VACRPPSAVCSPSEVVCMCHSLTLLCSAFGLRQPTGGCKRTAASFCQRADWSRLMPRSESVGLLFGR
jgi:hypothetical protein